MKRMAIVTATFVAVVLGCVSVWLPDEAPSRAQSSADAAAAVQGPRFKAMYEEWSAAHEQRGGDRNVTVTLAAASDNTHLAGAAAAPSGFALLNVIDGKVRLFCGTEPAKLFVSDDLGETWSERPGLRDIPTVDKWYFPGPPHIERLPAALQHLAVDDARGNGRDLAGGDGDHDLVEAREASGCLAEHDL